MFKDSSAEIWKLSKVDQFIIAAEERQRQSDIFGKDDDFSVFDDLGFDWNENDLLGVVDAAADESITHRVKGWTGTGIKYLFNEALNML